MFKDLIIRLITFDYYFIKRAIIKEFGFSKNARVLDLGCGTGTLSGLFNKEKYLGVDIDKDSISLARKKNKGYSFRVDDITIFKIKKKYDFVLVVGVIHHLDDDQAVKAFININKHLKVKGKALIIEAIPPINKLNILGKILRFMDRGAFVRKLKEYEKLTGKMKVIDSYEQKGGMVDYGVLVIGN